MHNSSLVAIAQQFWRIRTSVLYGNRKKFNTEAVNDYPPIRFEVRFEREFPIVSFYFLTLPVVTLRNLCPVEKLFAMRMAGLCQFYWRTCLFIYLFFMVALFCGPGKWRFAKVLHVVDLECHWRIYYLDFFLVILKLQGAPKSDEIWHIFRPRPQTFWSHARTRQNIVILKKTC